MPPYRSWICRLSLSIFAASYERFDSWSRNRPMTSGRISGGDRRIARADQS